MEKVVKTTPCKRCGRKLTAPKSISRRYGPVCWVKIGVPLRRRIHFKILRRKGLNPVEEFFGGK